MKSPPRTGSSGSSTDGKKVAPHPTGSGVKKSSARPKTIGKAVQVTGGHSPRKERKWQVFFDSAREVSSGNETVRARLSQVLAEESSKKNAKKNASKDAGERSEYDVKGLMAQIYQNLHRVATAQASEAAPGGAQTERVSPGKLRDTSLFLQEVSVGVTSVIKSALAHLYNPEDPPSSEVWDYDEKMARCLSYGDPSYERYRKLAAKPGWKTLSKLAHSAAFREAACTLDASTWQKVSASIDENTVSLIVFVESSGLEWWTELIHLNSLFPPSFDFDKYQSAKPNPPSPHKWVVTEKPEDIRRPKYDGKTQINILNNIYRASAFENSPRPRHWPADRPYPEDPTKVRGTSTHSCLSCGSHTPCTCSFTTSNDIWHPLVELRDYRRKGVGVRALQRIPARAILAEYVGEVQPSDYAGDPVYALDFSAPGRASEEVVATISAKRFGNWTRFINHSCDASTHFRSVVQGGRYRSVVQAVRDIEVFEEVTVDYGEGYWRHKVCECGVEGCYSSGRNEGPESWDLSTVVHED